MTTNVKSKLFKAEKTQWVIPCNPAYYDICGVFNKLDKVEWKQSTNVNEGDIVYIYVTSPIKEIRYKCIARKVDLDYADTEKDREFILKGVSTYDNHCNRRSRIYRKQLYFSYVKQISGLPNHLFRLPDIRRKSFYFRASDG